MDNKQMESTLTQEVHLSKWKEVILFAVGVLIGAGAITAFFTYRPDAIVEQEGVNASTQNIEVSTSTEPILKSISKEEYLRYAGSIIKAEEITHAECNKISGDWVNRNHCEEKYKLAEFPAVKRVSERCLEVTFDSLHYYKQTLCDDENIEGWPATSYMFTDYVPKVGYWFGIRYYEGSGDLIINEKTGEKIDVYGKPLFSPSGNRFLATSVDLEAGYNPNGFQIWQKQADSYRLRYQVDLNFGITDPVWVNENTFYFIKYTLPSPTDLTESNEYASYTFE